MENKKTSIIERIGKKIPDPVIIFVVLYVIVLLFTLFIKNKSFSVLSAQGESITYNIKNMFASENVRWIFDNAILNNWLAYGGGILGIILVVMFGVGVAEDSGLLSVLIKKVGLKISDRYLPMVLVFLGIMSSIATDAGYIVLVPLAGMLYAGLKKNPLIGMSAAFAGVSAGFSANLIPGTPIDVIIGTNAKVFSESQGIPFVTSKGIAINPATMHYIFIVVSTVLLSIAGYYVTDKIIKKRLESENYIIPEELHLQDFSIKKDENEALKWALLGFLIALIICVILAFGPLKSFIDAEGNTINPFMNNIIIIITFIFFVPGVFFGIRLKKYNSASDIAVALAKQLGNMGSVLLLTFVSYNFLALLSYSNLGTYITYLGAKALEALGLSNQPIFLLIGFIIITAIINLFVGGLTSKWMLLGPIFIPMLYKVNSTLTPEVVAAAYRVADSSTNVISPLMSYAGIILIFMKKYKPEYTLGDMIRLMAPYSLVFLISWTILLLIFFKFNISFGI
ncbi:MAG: AbgT family transporter [Clostridium sp.]|nr:AbgT family transporter [Clostridium sp.]